MFVYIIGNKDHNIYKIGISKDPTKRLKGIQTGNPFKLSIIDTFKTNYAKQVESDYHELFEEYKLEGEWFSLDKEAFTETVLFLNRLKNKKYRDLKRTARKCYLYGQRQNKRGLIQLHKDRLENLVVLVSYIHVSKLKDIVKYISFIKEPNEWIKDWSADADSDGYINASELIGECIDDLPLPEIDVLPCLYKVKPYSNKELINRLSKSLTYYYTPAIYTKLKE